MNFQQQSSYEAQALIDRCQAAILPIGAVEAHGPHLPLGTDNVLAERLSYKLAERTDSIVLPTLPYGQVWSLQTFPGSINVSNEALIAMLYDIGESLHRQGFRIFVMVNGHLGNGVALKEAARKLYRDYPELKVFYFFYPGVGQVTARVRESSSAHSSYFHACELETSYMLYLAEEQVDMSKALSEAPEIPMEADCTPTPWETFTSTAVLGDARLATKEKGEAIVETALANMERMLMDAKRRLAGGQTPHPEGE
ncbi:creatinine amidohydrolase [Paenibacillus sp. J31TS4]|uniref:creatininase family protein n=1 Tax=Paenibacillus sp. J31TS4 TaxID=2807195 RepID=UPI001B12262E|nr:creatininase family protein [Paenibacillus sp. J31TS4]GIP39917.1 creatinine amidohydrolase [Paenibacillus sp. J31TS4]